MTKSERTRIMNAIYKLQPDEFEKFVRDMRHSRMMWHICQIRPIPAATGEKIQMYRYESPPK